MSDPDPVVQPAAIPWYKSRILKGILTGVVAQIISRLQSTYHIDIGVWGLSVTDLVSWLMDIITAIAVAYTANARLSQESAPTVVSSQKKADAINITTPKEEGK